jgi:hypothetical protein
MNENHWFDDIARVMASPMPRRQALRRIAGLCAGAALVAVVSPGRAQAQSKSCKSNKDCSTGYFCCNSICWPNGSNICGSGASSICCPAGQVCCGVGSDAVCCGMGQTCKNGKCKGNISPS